MTTFGLVHGAWHGGWCWQHVVEELESRAFASVAPDLPVDDASAGIADYARTVVDALGAADDVINHPSAEYTRNLIRSVPSLITSGREDSPAERSA